MQEVTKPMGTKVQDELERAMEKEMVQMLFEENKDSRRRLAMMQPPPPPPPTESPEKGHAQDLFQSGHICRKCMRLRGSKDHAIWLCDTRLAPRSDNNRSTCGTKGSRGKFPTWKSTS